MSEVGEIQDDVGVEAPVEVAPESDVQAYQAAEKDATAEEKPPVEEKAAPEAPKVATGATVETSQKAQGELVADARKPTSEPTATEAAKDAKDNSGAQLPENAEHRTTLDDHKIYSAKNESGSHDNFIQVNNQTVALSQTEKPITNDDVNGAMKGEVLAAIKQGNEKPATTNSSASTPPPADSAGATAAKENDAKSPDPKPSSAEIKLANQSLTAMKSEVEEMRAEASKGILESNGRENFGKLWNATFNKDGAAQREKALQDAEAKVATLETNLNKVLSSGNNGDVSANALMSSMKDANVSLAAARGEEAKNIVEGADAGKATVVIAASTAAAVVVAPAVITAAGTAGTIATVAGASTTTATVVAGTTGVLTTGGAAVVTGKAYEGMTNVSANIQGVSGDEANKLGQELGDATRNSIVLNGVLAAAGPVASKIGEYNKGIAQTLSQSDKLTPAMQALVDNTLKATTQKLSGLNEVLARPANVAAVLKEAGNTANLLVAKSGNVIMQRGMDLGAKLAAASGTALGVTNTAGVVHGAVNTAIVQASLKLDPNAKNVSFVIPEDKTTLTDEQRRVADMIGQGLPGQTVNATVSEGKVFGKDNIKISATITGIGIGNAGVASPNKIEIGAGYIGPNGQTASNVIGGTLVSVDATDGLWKNTTANSLGSRRINDTTVTLDKGLSTSDTTRVASANGSSNIELGGKIVFGASYVFAPVKSGATGLTVENPLDFKSVNKTYASVGLTKDTRETAVKGIQDTVVAMGNYAGDRANEAYVAMNRTASSTITAMTEAGKKASSLAMMPNHSYLHAQNIVPEQPKA